MNRHVRFALGLLGRGSTTLAATALVVGVCVATVMGLGGSLSAIGRRCITPDWVVRPQDPGRDRTWLPVPISRSTFLNPPPDAVFGQIPGDQLLQAGQSKEGDYFVTFPTAPAGTVTHWRALPNPWSGLLNGQAIGRVYAWQPDQPRVLVDSALLVSPALQSGRDVVDQGDLPPQAVSAVRELARAHPVLYLASAAPKDYARLRSILGLVAPGPVIAPRIEFDHQPRVSDLSELARRQSGSRGVLLTGNRDLAAEAGPSLPVVYVGPADPTAFERHVRVSPRWSAVARIAAEALRPSTPQ